MSQGFQKWSTLKQKINGLPTRVLFKEGEIWWCSIGKNIGTEINGKSHKYSRPVIIFRKCSSQTFIGIPVSTKIKNGSWYYQFSINSISQCAVLVQMRSYDEKRLLEKYAEIPSHVFEEIINNTRRFLRL